MSSRVALAATPRISRASASSVLSRVGAGSDPRRAVTASTIPRPASTTPGRTRPVTPSNPPTTTASAAMLPVAIRHSGRASMGRERRPTQTSRAKAAMPARR